MIDAGYPAGYRYAYCITHDLTVNVSILIPVIPGAGITMKRSRRLVCDSHRYDNQ